jgi:hypothetical protein
MGILHQEHLSPGGSHATFTVRLDYLRAGVPAIHASGCLSHRMAPELPRVLDDELATAPRAIVFDLNALSVLAPDAVPTLVDIAHRVGQADIGVGLPCIVSLIGADRAWC